MLQNAIHFRWLIAGGLAAIFLTSCAKEKEGSQLKWWMGADADQVSDIGIGVPLPRGHDELLYQAILRANTMIDHADAQDNNTEAWYRFTPLSQGERGSDSTNQLMIGNFASDVPDKVADRVNHDLQRDMYSSYRKILGIPDGEAFDWHHDPRTQIVHFMSGAGESAQQACVKGRAHIDFLTQRSTLLWAEAHRPQLRQDLGITDDPLVLKERALFWAGVATHVIQDAFSPAHVQRASDDRRSVTDICVYEQDVDGRCSHSKVSTDDIIWRGGLLTYLLGIDESFESLKSEAQDAVLATANYLRRLSFLFKIAEEPAGELGVWTEDQMFNFFYITKGFDAEKALSEGSGWFRCDSNVSFAPPTTQGIPTFGINRTEVTAGADLLVGFSETAQLGDKAYLGLVPHTSDHQPKPLDAQGEPPIDVEKWLVLKDAPNGKGKFAIEGAGAWDIRLFDDDGQELKVVSFRSEPMVTVSKNIVPPGGALKFSVHADPSWDSLAFVTVVKANVPFDGASSWDQSLGRASLNKQLSLNIDYDAPSAPGNYQIRMYDGPKDAALTKFRAVAAFTVKGD